PAKCVCPLTRSLPFRVRRFRGFNRRGFERHGDEPWPRRTLPELAVKTSEVTDIVRSSKQQAIERVATHNPLRPLNPLREFFLTEAAPGRWMHTDSYFGACRDSRIVGRSANLACPAR